MGPTNVVVFTMEEKNLPFRTWGDRSTNNKTFRHGDISLLREHATEKCMASGVSFFTWATTMFNGNSKLSKIKQVDKNNIDKNQRFNVLNNTVYIFE